MDLYQYNFCFLEIALSEQQDFVDKIFLIESSFTHKGVRKRIEGRRRVVFFVNLTIYVLVEKTSSLGEAEVDQEV